ncbi:MAG: hypothetical protein Aurels2KO_33280 [Aureliella sp.]
MLGNIAEQNTHEMAIINTNCGTTVIAGTISSGIGQLIQEAFVPAGAAQHFCFETHV